MADAKCITMYIYIIHTYRYMDIRIECKTSTDENKELASWLLRSSRESDPPVITHMMSSHGLLDMSHLWMIFPPKPPFRYRVIPSDYWRVTILIVFWHPSRPSSFCFCCCHSQQECAASNHYDYLVEIMNLVLWFLLRP